MEVNHFDQKMMQPFNNMLRCRICSEFFNQCVMTSCSHNFCSACLKKRMESESDCPTCYEDIQESELRSNRSMDKIVRIYKKLIKTNATQSSELQSPTNIQTNPQMLNSSAAQSISQTQNCLPVQSTSTGTVPVQSAPFIQNIQSHPQSSASFPVSSAGTIPVQNSPFLHNLQTTMPVVMLQRLQMAVLPKANTARKHDLFDDFEDIENCSFTDDSNDSED